LIAFMTASQPMTEVRVATSIGQSRSNMSPDFTLPIINDRGLTGENLTLSNLRGRPVFLDFVFEWCPHCNRMTPRLYMSFVDIVLYDHC